MTSCLKIFAISFFLIIPFSSKISAEDHSVSDWETINERADRLSEDYSNGEWAAFLKENEAEYQEYITQNDPLLQIRSIEYDKRKKLPGQYLDLLDDWETQVDKLEEELWPIYTKYYAESRSHRNQDPDPSIIKMMDSISDALSRFCQCTNQSNHYISGTFLRHSLKYQLLKYETGRRI